MSISEIKKEAREVLKGKWGKAISILLAYMLIALVLGFIEGLFEKSSLLVLLLVELAITVVSVPLSFGLVISFIKFKRGENVKAFEFLTDGFSNFKKSLGIFLHTILRMLLPIICIILIAFLLTFFITFGIASGNYILTIVTVALYIATLIYTVSRGLLYTVAYNIGYDYPELKSKDCVNKSEILMKGNRGTYFLLELSFIGWAILSVFTLGIGLLWLAPYMQVAAICFYDKLATPEVKKIDEEVKIEE